MLRSHPTLCPLNGSMLCVVVSAGKGGGGSSDPGVKGRGSGGTTVTNCLCSHLGPGSLWVNEFVAALKSCSTFYIITFMRI